MVTQAWSPGKKLTLLELARKLRRGNRKLPKPPMPPTTKTLELTYYRALKAYVATIIELTRQALDKDLPKAITAITALQPTNDRMDEEIDGLIARLKLKIGQLYPDAVIVSMAETAAKSINSKNFKYFGQFAEKVAGINPIAHEPWLRAQMETFTRFNVSLIKSIPEEHLRRVESIISVGVQRGRLAKDIATDVAEKFDIPLNRAKLIARDQTAKFNSSLTRIRQTDLGISQYIWHTAGDERVRGNPDGLYPKADPSHWDRDGKVFDWNAPPEDGHPGEPINCRCQAIAVVEPQEPDEE